MNKLLNAFFLLLLLGMLVPSQAQRRLRVMTYNVENLFDTLHDAGYDDYEFLPSAKRQWDSRRYWKKQGMLCRTIAACGGARPVDLIALCEVENDSVVFHLTQRTLLRRLGYEYLISNSRDPRGIDVALLYQPLSFRPFFTQSLTIPFNTLQERPTRDILHIAGLLPTLDTLDIFLCHFPSRSGGQQATEGYRSRAAHTLRTAFDSLKNHRQHLHTLLLGDFNDEYHNKSLKEVLGAQVPRANVPAFDEQALYILSAHRKASNDITGTYKFRGEWSQLDQIIVNGRLLNSNNRLFTSPAQCRIADFPFLLEKDKKDKTVKTYRTYLGTHYHGGYSDHLPMLLDLYY